MWFLNVSHESHSDFGNESVPCEIKSTSVGLVSVLTESENSASI